MECMSKSIQTTLNHSRDNQASKRKKLVHRKNWARKKLNEMNWILCIGEQKGDEDDGDEEEGEEKRGPRSHFHFSSSGSAVAVSIQLNAVAVLIYISLFRFPLHVCVRTCLRVNVCCMHRCGSAKCSIDEKREKTFFHTHVMWLCFQVHWSIVLKFLVKFNAITLYKMCVQVVLLRIFLCSRKEIDLFSQNQPTYLSVAKNCHSFFSLRLLFHFYFISIAFRKNIHTQMNKWTNNRTRNTQPNVCIQAFRKHSTNLLLCTHTNTHATHAYAPITHSYITHKQNKQVKYT